MTGYKYMEINSYEEYKPDNQSEKLLYWFAFFMAFPVIVPVFNISVYLFIVILFSFRKRYAYLFRIGGLVPIILFFLALGVIINLITVISVADRTFQLRTLQVVPNYIYWIVLIWFLFSQREHLRLSMISKALFWGILTTIFFYFLIAPLRLHSFLPFIMRMSQNSFAFLIITFTPVAIRYSYFRYGRNFTIILLIILVLVGFLAGSRSSSVLVLLGGTLSLFLDNINFKKVLILTISLSLLFLLGRLDSVNNLVYALNPRAHSLFYETSKTMKTDRSYLTRKLQVEKGLKIYNEKPWTGTGLNNFSFYTDVELKGDFEGGKFVIHKKGMNRLSAHNSYVALLAEGGLFIVIPFGLLILYILIMLVRVYKELDSISIAFIIGFITMMIHLWFISAIVNVFCWFNIGVVITLLKLKHETKVNPTYDLRPEVVRNLTEA